MDAPSLGVEDLGLERVDPLANVVDLVAARLLGLDRRRRRRDCQPMERRCTEVEGRRRTHLVLGLHRRELVLEILQVLLGRLGALLGGGVLLALERVDLNLELKLLALEVVELLGPRLARDLDRARGLVDEVYGRR